MRNIKWLAAAVLVASTTGCVESVNQGYGYNSGYGNGYSGGYSNAYYPRSNGYYSQPARMSNYYYNPRPTVVTQTRYVPVPTPVPSRHSHRSNDHRWGGRDGDNHRQPHHQSRSDRPHNPSGQTNDHGPHRHTHDASGGNQHDGGNNRDRDGDGRSDRRG